MLDLHYVRDRFDDVEQSLRDRGADISLESFRDLDRSRRDALVEVEQLKKQRNDSSKEIGRIMKSGGDAEALKRETRALGERIHELEQGLHTTEAELHKLLEAVPNVPHESVPVGRDESANRVERSWGEKPEFTFEPQAHWDVGTALGILDFERAAKVAGARFALYAGAGARLERALIQFMLEVHIERHGYREILPPFLVNSDALFGTGQLPKFEADLFRAEPGGLYLVPTSEVPLTNLHADEILDPEQLPIAYCAYTPCFRSEAGSYGKDVRGLIRQHQFNKVELVRLCEPEDSFDQLERLTADAEKILQLLGLHYRVVTLCTGDIGFSATKTYDLEVWLPAHGVYREISSCSNCGDFQARRAKIRYRPGGHGKTAFLHTLNGSGLAVGRTVVALLENFQQADGSVTIPEVLRPYMGGLEKIEAPA